MVTLWRLNGNLTWLIYIMINGGGEWSWEIGDDLNGSEPNIVRNWASVCILWGYDPSFYHGAPVLPLFQFRKLWVTGQEPWLINVNQSNPPPEVIPPMTSFEPQTTYQGRLQIRECSKQGRYLGMGVSNWHSTQETRWFAIIPGRNRW